MSGNELRFPKTEDETREDPALVMARNSLKRQTPEPKVKEKKGVKTCWRCQEPVGKENLTQKWIRKLNAQRFLCDDCIPFKDEEFAGRTESGNYSPPKATVRVNGVEIKGKESSTIIAKIKKQSEQRPDTNMSVKSENAEPYQVTKIHTGDFIKFKECFKCDSNLFYVVKGKVVCKDCGSEYSL